MSDDIMPMVWNEPGSGGNKKNDNPWGSQRPGKGDGDGPPDLDQVFKNFINKIKQMFGFKVSKPSMPGGKFAGGNYDVVLVILLLVALLAYFAFGFYMVASYEQGVVTRFGKYSRTVHPGLHWLPVFVDKVQKVNTENLKSSRHSGWMLTKDENIILVEMEVQYRVIDAEHYLFDVSSPDMVLMQAADSALRQVVGDSVTDDVLTNKKLQIADAIKEQLVARLELYHAGFYIEAVNFRDSRPPDDVKDAFDDVTKSREDKERLKLQAEAYANTVIPEAEGAASRIIAEAQAYKEQVTLDAQGEAHRFDLILPGYQKAPQVTKTRMYLDTMETILANTTTVIVSTGAGNNLIYLPLDKLLDAQARGGEAGVPFKDKNMIDPNQVISKRENG